jgi:hypothetical protein
VIIEAIFISGKGTFYFDMFDIAHQPIHIAVVVISCDPVGGEKEGQGG